MYEDGKKVKYFRKNSFMEGVVVGLFLFVFSLWGVGWRLYIGGKVVYDVEDLFLRI